MKTEIYFYNKGYRITETGKILNPNGQCINGSKKDGYVFLSTRKDGVIVKCAVHRLQAFQKYGEVLFYDGVEVRHLNGKRTDNSFNNILIGTHSKNMMDTDESIRISKALHAASFLRKYNKNEVKKFHKENGCSYKKTMEKFKISSKGTLHYILNK